MTRPDEQDRDVFSMPRHLVQEELGPDHAKLTKSVVANVRRLSREHLRRQHPLAQVDGTQTVAEEEPG